MPSRFLFMPCWFKMKFVESIFPLVNFCRLFYCFKFYFFQLFCTMSIKVKKRLKLIQGTIWKSWRTGTWRTKWSRRIAWPRRRWIFTRILEIEKVISINFIAYCPCPSRFNEIWRMNLICWWMQRQVIPLIISFPSKCYCFKCYCFSLFVDLLCYVVEYCSYGGSNGVAVAVM